MPGKHAPKSPLSFYLSVGRAVGGVVGAVGLVVLLTIVAFGGRGDDEPKPIAKGSATPSLRPTATPRAPTTSPTAQPTAVVAPTLRAPSATTVAVLNGSGRQGLARRTAEQVKAAGYKVADDDIGNADRAATSTIYYQPAFEAEARELQKRFPGFTQVKPAVRGIPTDVMLTLVLGTDYPS